MNVRDYYMAGSNFGRYNKLISSLGKNQARQAWNSKYRMVGSGPRAFYQRKNSPNYDFSNLNGVIIPGLEQIKAEQIKFATNITFLQQGKDITNILNEIINLPAINNTQFTPDATISKLENLLTDYDNGALGSLYNTKSHQWSGKELLTHIQKHDQSIQELNNLISMFNSLSLNANQQAALKRLTQVRNDLISDISDASQLSNGEDFFIPGDRSYLSNLSWVANILKGRYLEIEGLKFLQENLPSNYEVVDLSSVQGPVLDIFSGGIMGTGSLRTDLGVFNRDIASTINMKWIINGVTKTGSLADFFDYINKNKTSKISIPNDTTDYINNLNNNIIGIQAKSGLGEIQFLRKLKTGMGRKITLGDVIGQGGVASQALKELNLLVTAPYMARLTRTHTDYDALFNFCLSRYLTQIIGQENQIILTRDGFLTVKDWLIKQFNIGRIMHATNRVHIDDLNASIGISFGDRII